MEDNAAELLTRIDAACRRMMSCIESRDLATIKEVEKLMFELAAERKKTSELEAKLEKTEDQSETLESLSRDLTELRAERSRDLEELDSIMSELRPIIKSGNRA